MATPARAASAIFCAISIQFTAMVIGYSNVDVGQNVSVGSIAPTLSQRARKDGAPGKLAAYGIRWKIAKALIGEWVHLERIGQRVLVYYCRTLIRELDLQSQSSIAVQRWHPQSGSETGSDDAAS